MKAWTRVTSLLLCIVMMFVFLPQGVLAEISEILNSQAEADETSATVTEASGEVSDEAATALYVLGEDTEKRTATSKTFRMSDGSYIAADYGKTVHFKDENGEWADYDNTLSASGADGSDSEDFSGVETQKSDIKFKFANNSQSSNLLKITKDDYKISLHLVGADKSKAIEVYDALQKPEGNDIESASTLYKFSGGAIYKDILPSTDLEYIVSGSSVKENIIVKEKCDSYEYTFELKLNGLVPLLLEDGSIALNDEKTDETQLIIPARFMYDAANESSSAVSYSIQHKNGKKYALTVTADPEWINAEERVFPVTIDPTFKAFYTTSGTMDAHISQYAPNQTAVKDWSMVVGYSTNSTTDECHVLIRPYDGNLPAIPVSAAVTSATLMFCVNSVSRNTGVYLSAHKITSTWDSSTVCWNNKPSYNSEILDYVAVTSDTVGTLISFDVTRAAREWYADPSSNYGIAICPISGNGTGSYFLASSDQSNYIKPLLIISYCDTKGLDGRWAYSSHSAGGTTGGYVNGFNGNLVLVHDDLSSYDSVLPLTVSHVFNTYLANSDFTSGSGINSPVTASFSSMKVGKGWKLSLQESLVAKTIDEIEYYVHNDADGTEHYYVKSGDEYISEDGLQLTVTVSGSEKTLADKLGAKKIFDANGRLVRIEDQNGNKKYLGYTSNQLTSIVFLPAGKTTVDTQIKLEYSGNMLSKIVNAIDTKEVIEYSYSAEYNGTTLSSGIEGYLRQITYKYDGTVIGTTYYDYNSDGTITSVSSVFDGVTNKTVYYYSSANSFKKISAVRQFSNDTLGQWCSFQYDDKKFQIRTGGNDDSHGNDDDILTHYLFDNLGRTICAYTTNLDGTETYGTSYQKFTAYEPNAKTNNKITVDSAKGLNNNNFVANSSFEQASAYWSNDTSNTNDGYGQAFDTSNYFYGAKSTMLVAYKGIEGSISSYQNITIPKTGVYTLSAYVKTGNITTDATDGGALIAIERDGVRTESEILSGTTNSNIQNGWQRISVTFTVDTVGTYRIELKLQNCLGTAYFDSVQLEQGKTPSSYNSVLNFEVDNGQVWGSSVSYITNPLTNPIRYDSKVRISGNPTAEKRAMQTVQLNKPANTTFMLTGWAKANSVYLHRSEDEEVLSADTTHLYDRKFSLMAKLYYTDGTTEETDVDFNANNTDWQYASTAVVAEKAVSYAEIYVLYDYNANSMYFDDISFTEEPAQTYTYDDEGNLITATDALGNQSSATYYDEDNSIDLKEYTTVLGDKYNFTYDDNHNVTTQTHTYGSVTQTTNYTYNSAGLVTDTRQTAGTNVITSSTAYLDSLDDHYSYSVSQITDSLGSVTNYSYDTATKLLEYLENANGHRTEYDYDYARKRAEKIFLDKDEDGVYDEAEPYVDYAYSQNRLSGIETATTTYSLTYDVYGNVTQIKAGDNVLASYEYAANNGKLLKLTYGNGDYEEYSYDHLDRLVKVLYNGDVEKYYIVYNADGGIYSITEMGTTHIYEYDSLDRLIRAWQKDSSGNIDLYVENSYDSYGRSTGSTYVVNGQTLSYTVGYNDVPNTVARFYYPTFGGDTKINFYTYDELQRLTKKDLAIDLMSKASESYEYYTYTPSSGTTRTTSLISKLTLNANGVETVYDYYYDALGNLFYIQKDGEKVTRYDYDELNQLVREDDVEAGYTYLYFYDLAGNVTEKRQYALATAPSYHILSMPDMYPYTVVESYSYSDSSWGDLLTNYNGTEITYDGLGNPLNWKNASSLTWEDRKLTAHDSLDNTVKSRYVYNSEGIRTAKTIITVGDTSDVYEYYDYILDGTKILSQHYSNSVTDESSYLYFLYDENGSVSGFNDGTNTYFYQKNIQGDIIRIVDVSGNVVVEYTYDAWGKVLSVTGSLADTIGQRNPFRYRGYYYDSETGWYYLNSRYYDPDVGRFVNADELDYLGADNTTLSYNLFAYCKNNPTNRFDIDGNWSLPNWAKIAIGATAIAVGVGVTALTGGAALPALVAGVKAACVAGAISAGTSAAKTAVRSAASGDSFSTVVQKSAKSAVDGFADGFMAGGIAAGASQVASGGFKIAAKLGAKAGKSGGIKFGNTKILSPDAVWQKNNGGTLLKVGKTFRIDVGSNTLLHMHIPKVSSHIQIGTIGAGMYGGLK